MSLGDTLRRWWAGPRPSESDLVGTIAWEAERRLGIGDYTAIPAVARGRQLIVSLIAQLEPVAWRDGYPLPPAAQPAILRRPAPEITRQEWLAQIAASLVDHGNAVLIQPAEARDATGWPSMSIVAPYDEVAVQWADEAHLHRTYAYRGRDYSIDDRHELVHVAIGRGPGELEGRSPLEAIGDSLARILAADLYSAQWFESGAVPSIVLKYDGSEGAMTREKAKIVKAQWIEDHADHSPAVLPKGWDLKETGASPDGSQLLETRKWGVLEVARGLGIFPAELLLAELGGSSLTYQNMAEALTMFYQATLQPVYMAALEESLSDLVPATQAVRFNTSELERLGTKDRYATYETGLRAGFLTSDQIDRWEGWNRAAPAQIPPQYAPTLPAPEVSDAA